MNNLSIELMMLMPIELMYFRGDGLASKKSWSLFTT